MRGRGPGARRRRGAPGGRGAVSTPRFLSPCRHVLAPKKGGHTGIQRGKARRPLRPPSARGTRPAAPASGSPLPRSAAPLPPREEKPTRNPGGGGGRGQGRQPPRGKPGRTPAPLPAPAVPAEAERAAGQVSPGLGAAAKGRAPRPVAGGSASPPRASVSPSVKRGLRARRVGRGRGSPRWGFAAPRARCGLGAGGRALPGRARH